MIRSWGVAAAIGIAAAGLGLALPAVANAQDSSPVQAADCGLSSGLIHWAYTNCTDRPLRVQINHMPKRDPNWSEVVCVGAGQVKTVGNVYYELVSANVLAGPCVP